ncbi:MAG: hypothetical protein M1825_005868 [Sarcosagium campestre]|nr:MAG: hypothetical protein M1825_005868 [Sarcosagium campestre]
MEPQNEVTRGSKSVVTKAPQWGGNSLLSNQIDPKLPLRRKEGFEAIRGRTPERGQNDPTVPALPRGSGKEGAAVARTAATAVSPPEEGEQSLLKVEADDVALITPPPIQQEALRELHAAKLRRRMERSSGGPAVTPKQELSLSSRPKGTGSVASPEAALVPVCQATTEGVSASAEHIAPLSYWEKQSQAQEDDEERGSIEEVVPWRHWEKQARRLGLPEILSPLEPIRRSEMATSSAVIGARPRRSSSCQGRTGKIVRHLFGGRPKEECSQVPGTSAIEMPVRRPQRPPPGQTVQLVLPDSSSTETLSSSAGQPMTFRGRLERYP